jgi:hypothetical protein
MANGILNGNVSGMTIMTATVDLGSVAANTSEEETATVSGVNIGDVVVCINSSLNAGQVVSGARVSAANTVILQVINTTGSAIDAGSKTMTFLVVRPENPNNIPTTVIK